jgi:elongation factor P--(R)-beta-lysine ligase
MQLDTKLQKPRWWHAEIYGKRRPFLRKRQLITQEIRNYFYNQGFSEVEATCLQISPGNETHISAFQTEYISPSGDKNQFYLHSSPEFMCKKLLSAGEERLFTIAKVFRNRERGLLHHPEFTMLEWYRRQDLTSLMNDVTELVRRGAHACATPSLKWKDKSADPFHPPEFLSVTQAFKKYADIDLEPLLEDRDGLAQQLKKHKIRIAQDDNWSDLFSKIISELIEPQLGMGQLTFLTDYPASEAALAQLNQNDQRFAQRFEVYACGVELANAFAELTDPIEQKHRFEHSMRERQRIYSNSYPIDDDFIDALQFMPAASGIALGLDRLVMLMTHARSIEDVIWAPVQADL